MLLGRPTLVVGAAVVLGLAGCGTGSQPKAEHVGDHQSSLSAAAGGSSVIGRPAQDGSLAALRGSGTQIPAARAPVASRRESLTAPRAVIDLVYEAWMSDLTGLFANLTQPWVTAVSEIATPEMTDAAHRSAAALQRAHDHGVGKLVDSRRVVTVTGARASLTDCLDEEHWYVVEDANDKPDPSVTRGYFVGTADFVLIRGQWYLSSWNSHAQRCRP